MSQIQCPKCGAILPPNTPVCPTCGMQLAQSYNNGQPFQQPQQPQPQQPQSQPQYQQPQPQQQYQQPQQQYQQPNPYNQQPYYQPQGGGNGSKILIGVLAALLILLAGGAVFYFMTQNQKNEEEVAELKEQIEKEKDSSPESEATVAEAQAPSEIVVKEGAVNADAHHAVSAGSRNATTQDSGPVKVVINGTGVRLRFAPSLNAGWLTWPNGKTRTVSKGTRLTYLGEDGDWYTVSYMGETFYVSKEYSYKVIPN